MQNGKQGPRGTKTHCRNRVNRWMRRRASSSSREERKQVEQWE